MSILVVYVIIAFLINTNVKSFPLIVFNACSQDPECFISYDFSFEKLGDGLFLGPPILHFAEKSYLYFPFTNGDKVRLLKHLDLRDPGTIMVTKTLADDNNCFVVSGNYSTAKVSNCLNASSVTAVNGTDRNLLVYNNSTKNPFITVMQLRYGADFIFTRMIYYTQTIKENFFDQAVAANINLTGPPIVSFFKKLREDSKPFPIEEDIQLGSLDTCINIDGSYEDPQVVYIPCETPRGRRPSTRTATTTTITERPYPLYELPYARK